MHSLWSGEINGVKRLSSPPPCDRLLMAPIKLAALAKTNLGCCCLASWGSEAKNVSFGRCVGKHNSGQDILNTEEKETDAGLKRDSKTDMW